MKDAIYVLSDTLDRALHEARRVQAGDDWRAISDNNLPSFLPDDELPRVRCLEPGGHYEDADGFHWVRVL